MKRSMILLAVAALIAATQAIAAPAAAKDGFPSWTPFNRSLGENPEGVAVDKTGNVYVSINPLGQVWKFAPMAQGRCWSTCRALAPPDSPSTRWATSMSLAA